MAFTYVPDLDGQSELDKMELRHRYFAKVRPDGSGLVPGLLVQGERPREGKWVDVAAVSTGFSERYFVQYTDFHTLVPGSLIQGRSLPRGKWKEVKPVGIDLTPPPFNAPYYRIVFSEPLYTVGDEPGELVTVVSGLDMFDDVVFPVLQLIHPDEEMPDTMRVGFYYFLGDYEELDRDALKMTSFADPNANDVYFGFAYTPVPDVFVYDFAYDEAQDYEMMVRTDMPDGLYSIILVITRVDPMQVDDVIVLEGVFLKESGS
jgi:hypothetical protein